MLEKCVGGSPNKAVYEIRRFKRLRSLQTFFEMFEIVHIYEVDEIRSESGTSVGEYLFWKSSTNYFPHFMMI